MSLAEPVGNHPIAALLGVLPIVIQHFLAHLFGYRGNARAFGRPGALLAEAGRPVLLIAATPIVVCAAPHVCLAGRLANIARLFGHPEKEFPLAGGSRAEIRARWGGMLL